MFDLFKKVTENEARQYSPVTLAFVGDAVYSLYIRHKEVTAGDKKLVDLQRRTSASVSAKGQNELLHRIEAKFTPTESDIFHRGRNAKKSTKSKNATVAEYNASTGFEAVLGYLYLTGQYDRISQLIEEEDE